MPDEKDPLAEAFVKNLAWNNENWEEADRREVARYETARPWDKVPPPSDSEPEDEAGAPDAIIE